MHLIWWLLESILCEIYYTVIWPAACLMSDFIGSPLPNKSDIGQAADQTTVLLFPPRISILLTIGFNYFKSYIRVHPAWRSFNSLTFLWRPISRWFEFEVIYYTVTWSAAVRYLIYLASSWPNNCFIVSAQNVNLANNKKQLFQVRAKPVHHAQLSKSSFNLQAHSFGVRLAGGSNCVFSSDAIYRNYIASAVPVNLNIKG